MILADLNQGVVVLQVFALKPDGSEKADVTGGTVRVYQLASGVETNVLAPTALANKDVNVWWHEWVPASLPVGQYIVEFSLSDAVMSTKAGEDLIVRDVAEQATLTDVQSTVTDVQSRVVLVQADLEIVKKVETGRWKIDNNQMVFYDTDETTPLLTFDLKDDAGLPSEDRVYERVPA